MENWEYCYNCKQNRKFEEDIFGLIRCMVCGKELIKK